MIVFDLKCETQGHVFEAWFGSGADYDDQRACGLVECPLCGSGDVVKAAMAPRIGSGSGDAVSEPSLPVATGSESVKEMLAAMAAAQRALLQSSAFVGDRFSEEARAMHLGERPHSSIHGRATREQARSLIEDGIQVAPLPFPVITPGEEN
jgi:hypothetical protein